MIQDLTYAFRQLRKSLSFTLMAVLTLALGIGAATAIFSLVDTVLLRPLPFPEPDRILVLNTLSQPRGEASSAPATLPNDTSYPNFFDWRDRSHSFSAMSSYQTNSFTLAEGGAARRIDGLVVAADFFRVLGIAPSLGRTFLREEEKAGNRSVIVSHSLWQTALNASPQAIGQTLRLSDETYTVVGVLPASFQFPNAPDVSAWITPALTQEGKNPSGQQRGWSQIQVLARLAPGVSLAQASAEMQIIQRSLVAQYPDDNAKETAVSLKPQIEDLTGDLKMPLRILFAAVAFLLLIACANVAGLLLTRTAARAPELALRTALGATRLQIVRQLLIESLALSTLGGLFGLTLAAVALRLAPQLLPNDLPRLNELSLNPRVFLFALAASLATGLLFGVLPAWRSSRLDPALPLRDHSRASSSGRAQSRLQSALVVGETALGLLLLVGAGLLIRSFDRLLNVDPGFNPAHLLSFRVGMPPKRFRDERLLQLTQQLQTRLAAVPGVQQATYGFPFPMAGGDMSITFSLDAHPTATADRPSARVSLVPANFFQAMQLPLRRGRFFSSTDDRPNSPPVIIINQSFADRFFPGEDPVGKRITSDMSSSDKSESREVVGVVGNVHRSNLKEGPAPEYFLPFAQVPSAPPIFGLRVAGDPANYIETVRHLVAEIDPSLPVYAVRTNLLTRSTAQQRFQTILISAFALLALLLAAVGLYAVLSYMVAQRTLELGLRMALGAQRNDVLTLILRRGLLLAVTGLALGLLATTFLTRYLAALLFQTPALDPLTLLMATAVLFVISATSCLIPSWRASRLNPNDIIRQQ